MDNLREENRPQVNGEAESQESGTSSSQESTSKSASAGIKKTIFDHAKEILFDAECLQATLKGLNNMALAHEIAIDPTFKLERPKDEYLSPQYRGALKAKDAYWQKLDEIFQSKSVKECEDIILDLMDNLKILLLGTMLPHNTKVKEKVEEELNLDRVAIEIDLNAFDFEHYMTFILDTLAALCCPVRDQEIVDIRSIELPSNQVRKTIELMENMNLDMANFIISQSRDHIIQNCVTYERKKFASFVDLQYRMGHDPIRITREWILRHVAPDRSFDETMGHAFFETLGWTRDEWPETLALDNKRYSPINAEINRIVLIGAVISPILEFTRSLIQSSTVVIVNQETSMAQKLLKLVTWLVKDFQVLIDPEDTPDPKKLENALDRISMQTGKILREFFMNEYTLEFTPDHEKELSNQIHALRDVNYPVRQLYGRRLREWIVALGTEEPKETPVPPQNLNFVGHLVAPPVAEYIRYVHFNRKIFDVVYLEIFNGECPPPEFYPHIGEDEEIEMEDTILNLLAKLLGLADKSEVSRQPMFRPQSPAASSLSNPFEYLLKHLARRGSN